MADAIPLLASQIPAATVSLGLGALGDALSPSSLDGEGGVVGFVVASGCQVVASPGAETGRVDVLMAVFRRRKLEAVALARR